jgi:Terminase large subunit, T4likevirus-type, N-terminal
MDLATEMSLQCDPSGLMEMAGFTVVDEWQRQLLRSRDERVLLCASRQTGKSTATSLCALAQAYLYPDSLVLVISASKDQAIELFRKISRFHKSLQLVPGVKELTDYLELANGSRILTLPALADSVRGYSAASLVVIDECAVVEDDVWVAVLPTVMASRGRVVCLSTPAGKSGRFYELWTAEGTSWVKITARASEIARISPESMALQRQDLGARRYRNEVDLEFLEDVDSYFSSDAIERLLEHVPSDRALPGIDLEDI